MKQRTNPTEKVLVVGINIGEQTNLLKKMIPIGEQKNLEKMIPVQQISCVGGRSINRKPNGRTGREFHNDHNNRSRSRSQDVHADIVPKSQPRCW